MKKIQLLTLIILVLAACERNNKEYSNVQALIDAQKYLVSANTTALPAESHVKEVAPGSKAPLDGKALYATNCAACHQVSGKGIPGAFPPLDESPYVTSDNLTRLASIMIYGLSGPINVNGVTYNSAMAPLGGQLNDEELAAIATYIRSAWSNKAPAVEAKVFTETREKWGERGMCNIQELGEEK